MVHQSESIDALEKWIGDRLGPVAVGRSVGSEAAPDVAKLVERDGHLVYNVAVLIGPDGTIIGPPMPLEFYREISDRDAAAIAAYLHSVKPIGNAVAKTQFKIPLPPTYGRPVTHADEPPRTDKIAYGGYLAGPVGHCVLCHTPPGDGKPFDMSRPYGGGRELPDFAKPGALTVSRNITPDPENGIGKWSDAEVKRAITAGICPDGTRLTRTMPFDWYAKIAPADLDALVAYLRSLKPVK